MSEWKNGNYVGACPNRLTLKKMFQKNAGKKYPIKGDDGVIRMVYGNEVTLEQMFHNAISGDLKALKYLFEWAGKYWHDPEKKSPTPKVYLPSDIEQWHVDDWKASGSLPAGCSEILSEISTADLNKARRLHIKKEKAQEKLAKQTAIVGTFG